MAEVLKVDAEALHSMAADITSVSEDLNATHEPLGKHSAAVWSQAGRDGLSGFESHRSRGRSPIAEKVSSLGQLLSDSADTYAGTDAMAGGALTLQKPSTYTGARPV